MVFRADHLSGWRRAYDLRGILARFFAGGVPYAGAFLAAAQEIGNDILRSQGKHRNEC